MSPAICCNLDQSKILLSGDGLCFFFFFFLDKSWIFLQIFQESCNTCATFTVVFSLLMKSEAPLASKLINMSPFKEVGVYNFACVCGFVSLFADPSYTFSRYLAIFYLSKNVVHLFKKYQYIQGLNPFPNKSWFLLVCCTSLLKTLWEKKKLLVTSNFFSSHSVFFPFR